MQSLSFDNAFNPYVDFCDVHDLRDAPQNRFRVLSDILQKATEQETGDMWIGRDFGYRGGRRTGLAFTDDVHLQAHAERWGLSFNRPTTGEPVAERTATVVWQVLRQIQKPIFLWNVFPLHPHKPENPFSNRPCNAQERKAGEQLLRELVNLLRPQCLIAIGNDAAKAARRAPVKCEVIHIRHPSYGGQNQFLTQMRQLYGL